MSSLVGAQRGPLARFAWDHPEWWTYLLSTAAWWLMLVHAVAHGAHAHHHLLPAPQEWLHWLLMIGAMMLPLQGNVLRWVAFRSFPRHRQPAIGAFVVGYLGVWALAGLPVVGFRSLHWTHAHAVAAAAFALAAAWAATRWHERALEACHFRRALSPRGWAAPLDACKYGIQIALPCVTTCWPLMLACAVTGHSVIAMLGGGALAAVERLSFRPSVRTVVLASLALAAWHVVLTIQSL